MQKIMLTKGGELPIPGNGANKISAPEMVNLLGIRKWDF